MSRPSRPWFRFYVEATTDRKLRRLAPAYRWCWVAVLTIARKSPRPGWLLVADEAHELAPVTVDDLMDEAALPRRDVEGAMTAFIAQGMVEHTTLAGGVGVWRVIHWDDRQFESDSSTERVAKGRSKQQDCNTQTSLLVTPPETETETESERPRARDPFFDAFVDLFGEASTKSRAAHYGKVIRELKAAGATPKQIVDRGRVMLGKDWKDAGPAALAKHWDQLGVNGAKAGRGRVVDFDQRKAGR